VLFELRLPHNESLADCHSTTATKPVSRCRNPTSLPFIKVCSYEIIFIPLELNYFSAPQIQDWNRGGKPQNGASESIPHGHMFLWFFQSSSRVETIPMEFHRTK